MVDIPKTRQAVPVAEAERLRDFTRTAEFMNRWIAGARVARTADAAALAGLLCHESIGPRIYTMPSPINAETMTGFIADHLEQRARGEGILVVSFNAAGEATAYFDVELWPQWSVADLAGRAGWRRSNGASTSWASCGSARRRRWTMIVRSGCCRSSASDRWARLFRCGQMARRDRLFTGKCPMKTGFLPVT